MVVVSVPDRQAQLCDFARLIEKNTRIGWQFR